MTAKTEALELADRLTLAADKAEENGATAVTIEIAGLRKITAALSASAEAPGREPDKRRCHSPEDRCEGCPHYYGKADTCIYAPKSPSGTGPREPLEVPPDPFADIHGKRMSELNDEQQDRAIELWCREQIGWEDKRIQRHLGALFRVIDRLREEKYTP